MSYESDRAWREQYDAAAFEDAWQHALMIQDLRDEHGSRWAGAPHGGRNGASPAREHDEDTGGSPLSRPAFPDHIERLLYGGFKEDVAVPSIKQLADSMRELAHDHYTKGVLDGFDKCAELMGQALEAGAEPVEALARTKAARGAIADIRALDQEHKR